MCAASLFCSHFWFDYEGELNREKRIETNIGVKHNLFKILWNLESRYFHLQISDWHVHNWEWRSVIRGRGREGPVLPHCQAVDEFITCLILFLSFTLTCFIFTFSKPVLPHCYWGLIKSNAGGDPYLIQFSSSKHHYCTKW